MIPAELDLDGEGLFGAATRGVFDPAPVVAIDGIDVASGPGPGLPTSLVVVDGLEFTWGREEVMDQPDPATGTLQLFDPSGTWATSADLRGKPVTISYAGTWDGAPVRRIIFRGRVGSPVKVARKTVLGPNGTRLTGALITLPIVSILLDLANMRPAAGWPEESVGARTTRIAGAVSSVLSGIDVRDYWEAPSMAAVPFKDQVTYFEHLMQLYESTGADRMTYNPHENTVTNVIRRDPFSSRGLAKLWWDANIAGAARSSQGVYARASFGLDSAAFEYDPADGITQPEKMTRVELSHPSTDPAFTNGRVVTRNVTGVNELRDGVRTVRLDSQLTWNFYADVAASDLEDMAQKEAAAWRLEPVTYHAGRVGGFESAEHARLILQGTESAAEHVFLQRSWLPSFGLRPIVGFMGGTIAYRDGGWQAALIPAPITTTLPQHAITWDEIDDGTSTYEVQWHDGDHARGMHESLTLEDLGYVARGLGADPPYGPDLGWDTYQ